METSCTYAYFVLCCGYLDTGRMAERERDMFTVAETAQVLGLSVRAVQDRIRKGEMAAEKITPRLYLVHRNEIERWKPVGKRKGGRPRKEATIAERRRDEREHQDVLDEGRERIRTESSAPRERDT
jgi:excisionase family DNA binding protein